MSSANTRTKNQAAAGATPVVTLTPGDFREVRGANGVGVYPKAHVAVNGDRSVTAVLFYVPGCHWCTQMKPQWKAFADASGRGNLRNVTVAAMDCSVSDDNITSRLGISGYPTIIHFANGQAHEYEGERSAAAFARFANKLEAEMGPGGRQPYMGDPVAVDAAMAPYAAGVPIFSQQGANTRPQKNQAAAPSVGEDQMFSPATGVVELTDRHYDLRNARIAGVKTPMLVIYYAPWCSWCRAAKDEWVSLVQSVRGMGVTVAALNSEKYGNVAHALNVRGYPTIHLYTNPSLRAPASNVHVFLGPRNAAAMTQFAKKNLQNSRAAEAFGDYSPEAPESVAAAAMSQVRAEPGGGESVPTLVVLQNVDGDETASSPSTSAAVRMTPKRLARIQTHLDGAAIVKVVDCNKHAHVCSRIPKGVSAAIRRPGDGSLAYYRGDLELGDLERFVVNESEP